ncbi:hypothetical protein GQ457_13G014810 [Hibiscus cannabinus]
MTEVYTISFFHGVPVEGLLSSVDPTDYMPAICGNDTLQKLFSPGKSINFFYLTQDERFMLKIVKKAEIKGSSGGRRNKKFKFLKKMVKSKVLNFWRLD